MPDGIILFEDVFLRFILINGGFNMPFYSVNAVYSALVREEYLVYVNEDKRDEFENKIEESSPEDQLTEVENRYLDRKGIEVMEVINVTSVEMEEVL
jgi:hypothetical protein